MGLLRTAWCKLFSVTLLHFPCSTCFRCNIHPSSGAAYNVHADDTGKCTCRGPNPSVPATTCEVIRHFLFVSGQRSLRGYSNWSTTFRRPETRKWRFEIQEGQETGAICNRHATPVDDRPYRVPDRCYHATHLGQGQSSHRGGASVISLTGLELDTNNNNNNNNNNNMFA